MTDERPNVKLWTRALHWIDCHPRTGWYLVTVATLNLLLNFVDAFDLF